MQQLLLERIRHRSPFAYVLIVFSYVTASKISLIQIQGCEKINSTQIHKPSPKIRSRNLNPVTSIDPPAIERCRDCNNNQLRSSIDSLAVERCRVVVEISVRRCRAICPILVNNFSSLVSWSNLQGFNTRLEQHVS